MTEKNDDNTEIHIVLAKDTMVHHYRIIEKIGAGGMGEVYLAQDTKLKRNVALKFLLIDKSCDSAMLNQFLKEAQAVARLQHPNIITIYEVNEFNNVPYISMEYLQGQSLKDAALLKNFSIDDIIDIGIQISSGLTEAHEKGIIHRDLKPGNIVIDNTGSLKILDFGLATLSDTSSKQDSETTVTSNPFANKIAGTLSYMAPEQLLGQEISSRVDIFAFGVILYELISGKNPFQAKSVSEVTANILRDTPLSIMKLKKLPYDLDRILYRCLQKKQEKRFQTARDVCNELSELSHQLEQNITIDVDNNGTKELCPIVTNESLVLTTELIRKLSHKDPKMIGTKLAYIDNGVASEEIIFYLHGIGADHRQFADALLQLPYRAVALSLYGFDENAQLRVPLTLPDHSILLHALIKDVVCRLKSTKIVFVGFSSGADHLLHCLSSALFDDITVMGMLSLGCNIHFDDCFATSKLSELASGNENQILSIIKLFSQNASTLDDWVLLHNYLVGTFSKFGIQTDSFSKYSSDILAPFKSGGWDQFPKWYKSCINKVEHIRFITDTGGYKTLDSIMLKHLEENVLGDNFDERIMMRVPESHIDLKKPENVLKYTNDFMKLFK